MSAAQEPEQDDLADESVAPDSWTGEPDRQPSEDLPTPVVARVFGKPLRGEQVVSPAVAQAVARLHQPDDLDSGLVILTELARCLHVHAARSLIFLAHRAAAAPHERWPALLRQAFEHAEARDLLLELWRAALTELMVTGRGWQALLRWLLRPDELDELHDFTVVFAADLLRTPVLRHRADFHLSQWLRRYPEAPALPHLRHLLKGSS